MRHHGRSADTEEHSNAAAWEAARGALVGATKYGLLAAAAGGIGYRFSPLYRGFTIQFKVFIQMSGMILGSIIEADKRIMAFEQRIRHQKRMARDMAAWRQYEEEFESKGTPGVGGEGNVKGNKVKVNEPEV